MATSTRRHHRHCPSATPALPLPPRGRRRRRPPAVAGSGALDWAAAAAGRATLGAGRAPAPAAVLGDGKPAEGVPDLQRRGPGADAAGRSAAARARCRDRDRAHRRPAGPRRLRRRGRQRAGPAVARAPSRCPRSSCPTAQHAARPARRGSAPGPWWPRRCAPCSCWAASSCWGRTSARRWARRDAARRGSTDVCASPTTCWAKARAPTPTRCATSPATSDAIRRIASARDADAPVRAERRHLHQAQRPASALRGRAARARAGRTGAARVDAVRAGGARQHQPHHRRRGSRPARAVARRVRGAGRAASRAQHPQWQGFGLALQAYQTRALELVEHVAALARRLRPALHVPAGQGRLLGRRDQARAGAGPAALPGVHAQAPHRHLLPGLRPRAAGGAGRDLSAVRHAQRRHHRGDPADGRSAPARRSSCSACTAWARACTAKCCRTRCIACRVYAPVGQHRDLLAYLVRRLLENGANSSFVHQLADESVGMDQLLASPLRLQPQSVAAAAARAVRRRQRKNSTRPGPRRARRMRAPLLRGVWRHVQVPPMPLPSRRRCRGGRRAHRRRPIAAWRAHAGRAARAPILRRAADAMEAQLPQLCALLVKEAFKTWGDCVAEVREAVDFLRYYADEAERIMQPRRAARARPARATSCACTPRGPWVCISPWNFPLAIFTGQVAAALATGNTVLAKPAEQTPAIALEAVRAAARGRRARATRCSCCTAPAKPSARRWWPQPAHRRRGVHRLDPGRQDHPARAGGQGRRHRAADRRDRRHQRHGGRLHRAARAGGRRGGAERLPLGRPALLGAAPAVRARGHRRRRDRDDPRRGARTGRRATRRCCAPTSGR